MNALSDLPMKPYGRADVLWWRTREARKSRRAEWKYFPRSCSVVL